MKQNTRELALCGLLCALSVTFLCVSGVFPPAFYMGPMLASVSLLVAREYCRPSYAWSCFAASAVLGLLLCADKECAVLFCFLGYYPLLQPLLDRIAQRAVRFLVKLAFVVFAVGLMYALLLFVFQLDAVVREFAATAPWLLWATALLGVVLFFVFDRLLRIFSALLRRRKRR